MNQSFFAMSAIHCSSRVLEIVQVLVMMGMCGTMVLVKAVQLIVKHALGIQEIQCVLNVSRLVMNSLLQKIALRIANYRTCIRTATDVMKIVHLRAHSWELTMTMPMTTLVQHAQLTNIA
jgi:hypothetical protein